MREEHRPLPPEAEGAATTESLSSQLGPDKRGIENGVIGGMMYVPLACAYAHELGLHNLLVHCD